VAVFVILCAKKATGIITKNGNKFIDRRNWVSITNSLLSRKVISYLNVEARDKELETVKYPA